MSKFAERTHRLVAERLSKTEDKLENIRDILKEYKRLKELGDTEVLLLLLEKIYEEILGDDKSK